MASHISYKQTNINHIVQNNYRTDKYWRNILNKNVKTEIWKL